MKASGYTPIQAKRAKIEAVIHDINYRLVHEANADGSASMYPSTLRISKQDWDTNIKQHYKGWKVLWSTKLTNPVLIFTPKK